MSSSSPLGTTKQPFLTLPKIYKLLTKVQNSSAYVFSTFTAIHGLQILAANTGGVALSNHWIILGRPLYQDEHLEGILVTGSAIVHVTAGCLKWIIRKFGWKQQQPDNANNVAPYHRFVGYALVPLAGLHYYLVRSLPIEYYGDSSFIDFGYIAWGLQNKPIFTCGLHSALAAAATYHIVSGSRYLLSKRQQKNKLGWVEKSVIAGLSVAFVSSLFIIGYQTKKIPLRLDFEKMYQRII